MSAPGTKQTLTPTMSMSAFGWPMSANDLSGHVTRSNTSTSKNWQRPLSPSIRTSRPKLKRAGHLINPIFGRPTVHRRRPVNVRCWHKADILNALTNVRFLGAKRSLTN
jgi:hypothetical protein